MFKNLIGGEWVEGPRVSRNINPPGKTLPEAIGEVARAGNIFKFFAGEALRGGGQYHVRRQDADRHLRQAVIDNNMPAGDAAPLTVTANFLTGGVQKQLSSTTTVRVVN